MIFLRPWGFLMLLVPLFWWWHHRRVSEQSPWKKFMDKDLWEALKVKSEDNKSGKGRSRLILILWLLWTVALSGPAWYKLPMPARISQPNTVLIMDLNPDVSAENLKKLQMRLYDILDLLKGHRVALVLYGSNEGYTAMPLTPDRALVQQLIPDLVPSVLPQPSTNPKKGIAQAEKVLKQTGQTGQIIFLTSQEGKLSSSYPIYTITPQTNLGMLWEKLKAVDAMSDSADYQAEAWADMGIWIALISVPLMLLCFRRNVLFLLLLLIVAPVEAGFLTRPDQEAYKVEQEAVQAYRQGDYTKAHRLFHGSYNKGNALAFQGQIERAIAAYEQALKENPNDADAKFNKEYLEKQLMPPEQQDQDEQQKQNQSEKNNDEKKSNDSQEQNKEEQSQEDQSEQPNDPQKSQAKEDNKQQNKQNNAQPQNAEPTQDQTITELEQALAEQPTEEPFNQKEQQILNRLNLDPSRVLRYRLNLQHQRNQR